MNSTAATPSTATPTTSVDTTAVETPATSHTTSITPPTIGERLKALRLSKKMSVAKLSRLSGLSTRSIHFFEKNERQPRVAALKRLSAALEVEINFFIDDDIFQEKMDKENTLAKVKELYGTRGVNQMERIYKQTRALVESGKLSEKDHYAFRNLMIELFFETKEEAKKYTPKKYRKDSV